MVSGEWRIVSSPRPLEKIYGEKEWTGTMKENVLGEKAYRFALRTVKLSGFLREHYRECELAKQVLRSGTSIGANVEESVHAQSRRDFVNKLSIAQKEACETNYWIRLLRDSGYIGKAAAASILSDCDEIQRILAASIKTAKRNLDKGGNES